MLYIIIKMQTRTIPGDERSRTAPGHGYPEHTVSSSVVALSTTKRDEWEDKVRVMTAQNERFVAGVFYPATVETVVNVSIKDSALAEGGSANA